MGDGVVTEMVRWRTLMSIREMLMSSIADGSVDSASISMSSIYRNLPLDGQ